MLEKQQLQKEAKQAINWIKKYVETAKAKGIVIGNSGGKDSATVLAMAVKAIGKEKVLAVSMPCCSNKSDLEDAQLVATTFGVKSIKIDLSHTYEELESSINNQIEEKLTKEANINIKPRLRMTTLYAIAQTYDYLVIGTGNLCEAMVGYTTKWGDNSSDFNPIANFTVEEVLQIGKELGVPDKILNKPPSDGLGSQTDEEKMGIQYHQIAQMIETGNTEERAKQEIIKRYQNTKHKRNLVPTYMFKRNNYLLEQKGGKHGGENT